MRSILNALGPIGQEDTMTESRTDPNRDWSRTEVENALRDILVDSLGVHASEVTPSASLVRDLGAESIDFLDIGFKVQQTLGVHLQTAEIRNKILAWSSLILPTLAEVARDRHGVTVSPDELQGLEPGGVIQVVGYLRTAKGIGAAPDDAECLARLLVDRLVKEFSVLGLTVSEADQEDIARLVMTDLSRRRLTERTLDLLTVGALTNFVCVKLGARLRV